MSEIKRESRIEKEEINTPLKRPENLKSGKNLGKSSKESSEKGSEKLLVLPVNENSRKITQTLSNETSLKILELLGKKKLSASDIAEELKIPLTTVKYNLDSLVESDLIKVKQIKWSQKGRQIKIYEAMEKLIVLVPSKGFSDKLSILSLLQQYIGVIAGACFAALGIEYLTAYLRARSLIKALPWNPNEMFEVPEAGNALPSPETPSEIPPEATSAPMAIAANNTSEGEESALSPTIIEKPEFAAEYYSLDEGAPPIFNGTADTTFAGNVENTSMGGNTFEEDSTEKVREETAEEGRERIKEAGEAEAVRETQTSDTLEETETPIDAFSAEGPSEGMNTSAMDSLPPGSFGSGAGQHFFDTLLAHPGIWFLFGCLFVICLLIIREAYYKKKSM